MGRKLIQAVLRSAATIKPTDEKLRATLTLLSSPLRSMAIVAICEEPCMTSTRLPGTEFRLDFALAGPAI